MGKDITGSGDDPDHDAALHLVVQNSIMTDDVSPSEDVLIRRFETADAGDTWRVFHAAVHGTASRDYTPEQIQAWAPPTVDEAAWQRRRSASHTYLACLGGAVVGFSDFTDEGLLDMLFVHPDAGGRGVARALVTHVLHEAAAAGHHRLHVHASLTARPAFERFGFTVDVTRLAEIRGQKLRNFDMSIDLKQIDSGELGLA
ncbi:putative acetyltransferase [Kineococcus xinjiangensis]|uniref:Putative acetyltransferase n=1 Tax=Kineococcus xinjiangensis TaxID=512762 RepID=A0A2S6IKI7_9ACTN|nr:GNAT family N-acetyltransferase [Kineococcus xinjiangensis]PPK94744.1 putative acetyltransferase [Kineococcus xinjiangensis]